MKKINKSIFKTYDIRGIYPDPLDEETAYLVGQGFANLTDAKKVVVGRDMRIGSPELFKQLVAGLVSQGVQVDDIGLVPIDAVYFSVGKYDYDGGIMVTASHNPKEYNGFKMVVKNDQVLNWIRGKELYDFIHDKTFSSQDQPGTMQTRDIIPDYIRHVLSFIEVKKIRPFKIVVDAGNGLAGKIMPLLFESLPGEIIPLNFKLDGNFPAHPSNPLLPESQVEIKKKVVETKADFGVILDGDTDRLFFIDEMGNFIRADVTLLILAKYFLEKNPNAGIVYNVICSKAVPEKIRAWGGRPIRSAVGFVNLARAMQDNNGVMSGELSAHYAFKDNYYADSGFISFVILLMLISQHDKKLSQITAGLSPYFKSDEINIEIDNIPAIITKVKKKYNDGHQDELDGLTVEYEDWWFNVRPSNTEPLLRITIEGDTKELLEQKQKEIINFIESITHG
ncbi:phosphomannomutase/phosphoglucomutase [Patescibacteria group bacterium]|nr:phosphomannomutase/phosphoglucomutase [Patescibacteria group bacterium]